MRRVDAIDEASQHLGELAQSLQRNGATAAADAMQSLQAETRHVAERLRDLEQLTGSSPVSQTGLNQGGIELF
jgi:hypothetical protein